MHSIADAFVRGVPAEEEPVTTKKDMKPFLGDWEIDEMDGDDELRLDRLGPPRISFGDDGRGDFLVFNIEGNIDARYQTWLKKPYVEFTWDGETEDEGTISGRGWARVEKGGGEEELVGRLFVHRGPEMLFAATRCAPTKAKGERKKVGPKVSKARPTERKKASRR